MLVHLLKFSRFRFSTLPEEFNGGNTVRKRQFISVEKGSPTSRQTRDMSLTSCKPSVNPDFMAGLNHAALNNSNSQQGAKKKHEREQVRARGKKLPVY